MMIILGSWFSTNQIWSQAPTLHPCCTYGMRCSTSQSPRIAATASPSGALLASRPKLSG